MSSLNTSNYSMGVRALQSNPNKGEYNNVPVAYCKHCLSLSIREIDGSGYCDKCGSTDVGECHISEWEGLYEKKYGEKYVKKE